MHCIQCRHLMDPHILFPVGEDPDDGGLVICDHDDCECFNVWSVDGRPPPRMQRPTVDDLNRLRAATRRVG